MDTDLGSEIAKDKVAQMGAGMSTVGLFGKATWVVKITSGLKATALGATIGSGLAPTIAIVGGAVLIGVATARQVILWRQRRR